MKKLKRKMRIPIHGVDVWIIITDDIIKARQKMSDILGELVDLEWYVGVNALCANKCGNFALFFLEGETTLREVAHEVFHLTHRILEWENANFDSNHHEQGALLNGYLMVEVCKLMKFAGG